jgi:PGAP1-like protein
MITGLRKRPHSKTDQTKTPTSASLVPSGKNDEDDDSHHAKDDTTDKVLESTSRNNTRTPVAANDPTPGSLGGATTTNVRNERGPSTFSLPAGLVVLVHALAIVLFVLGFVWRMKLHTGQECDMTYSYRIFLEIQMQNTKVHPPLSPSNTFKAKLNLSPSSPSSSPLTSRYRMYKFVDQRDPRYQDIWKDPARYPQPLQDTHADMWCRGKYSNRTTSLEDLRIVLYIPGHWGSYEQSRSIGAHGLQLTRQNDSPHHLKQFRAGVSQNSWTGNKAVKEGAFIYDVYAVDFAEQGTALHGEFLLAQSNFVARVVEQLVVRIFWWGRGKCKGNPIFSCGSRMVFCAGVQTQLPLFLF